MDSLHQPIKKIVMGIDNNFRAPESEIVGKTLQPSENLMFTTSNPELAAEMEQKYDGHVIVADYPVRTRANGATLFRSWPEMPLKKEATYENPK